MAAVNLEGTEHAGRNQTISGLVGCRHQAIQNKSSYINSHTLVLLMSYNSYQSIK